MILKDHSQAGQTAVAHALWPTPGVFMDIGAGGLVISNTLGLEEIGWTGHLLDNSKEAYIASISRKSPFTLSDATRFDYSFLPPIVEYGSFDIDSWTLAALSRVFETATNTRFRILTVEHDSYQHGELLRTPIIELLVQHRYLILCADVCHEGKSFETWAVDQDLVDMRVADKFRRNIPTDWKEIIGL